LPSVETLLYSPALSRDSDAIPIGWLYPAPYGVSMSSLGYLSLFRQLDERPDVHPTRLNSDNLNGFQATDFELIGISFAFELDILEILKQFEQLGLPLLAKDRPAGKYPLIFAGGPVPTTNPEPYADFFDFFIIGDGEDALNNILATYHPLRAPLQSTTSHDNAPSKDELLLTLAQGVPGLYAPSLYHVKYQAPDGPIASITARLEGAPMQISRQSLNFEGNTVITTPILTADTVFADKFLIEVMRGCAHRCRFCLASYATLPAKGPQANALLSAVDEGLKHTRKLGLLGALVADHPDFEALCERLLATSNVEASMASLRADTVTPLIAKTVKHTRQNSVTLAIESGSERVRKRINKHLRTEHIHRAAETLVAAGIPTLKLYFIAGLPEEGDAEMDESIALIRDLKRQHPKLKLNIGCSTFVPKAQTPFQWVERGSTKQLADRQEQFRKGIYKIADFRPSSAKWDTFQAILSRGDRRLRSFILEFAQSGANLGAMNRALKQIKQQHGGRLPFPDLEWYGNRERPQDEILPWDLLFLGVSKDNLYKEAYLNIT
jgi:radical SAM superfamily enzyme YgiQ (UPF0313 family)